MQIFCQSLGEIIQINDMGTQRKIMEIIQINYYVYHNTKGRGGGDVKIYDLAIQPAEKHQHLCPGSTRNSECCKVCKWEAQENRLFNRRNLKSVFSGFQVVSFLTSNYTKTDLLPVP